VSQAAQALAEFEQTIVAVASCTEPSARGVVRLSGLDVSAVLSRMDFRLSNDPNVPNHQQQGDCLGRSASGTNLSFLAFLHGAPSGDPSGARPNRRPQRIECAIDLGDPIGLVPLSLLYWPTARSYTGQPSAELHLIGSQPLLRGVVDCAMRGGARAARPGEFTLRAFLGGRLDLTQAEAVLGVIEAEGRGSLHQALEQLSGNLSRPLEQMRDEVLNLLADVEAGLDFVDEDIEFISDEQLIQRLEVILQQIDQAWMAMQQRGGGGAEPLIAIRGEPNAGKSFLMNQLAGAQAAIVADVPGTTRDVVYATAKIGQRQVRLADTAGIEPGRDEIERLSQVHAETASQKASLRLWCIDASRDDFQEALGTLRLTATAEQKSSVIDVWVATKMDQCEQTEQQLLQTIHGQSFADHPRSIFYTCSALTGQGMDQLIAAIEDQLNVMDREEVGSVLGTAARCRQTLSRAKEAAGNAIRLTQHEEGHEFVASEIRLLAEAIGEVTGAVYTDDLLDRVFSRFCIGK